MTSFGHHCTLNTIDYKAVDRLEATESYLETSRLALITVSK